MSAAVVLESIALELSGQRVLDDFSLTVEEGEIVSLVGPSGSGKTSVLRVILGFETPSAGSVKLAGKTVSDAGRIIVPPEERGIGIVFQDLALWPHLTVEKQLLFGLTAQHVPQAEAERRVRTALEQIGLADKALRLPGTLSGGERQRIAIARALVLRPRAILLDEPLANLDAVAKRELLGVFGDLLALQKTSAIYVTHDLREAAELCDRITIIEKGRPTQNDTLDALRRTPATEFIRQLIECQLSAPRGAQYRTVPS